MLSGASTRRNSRHLRPKELVVLWVQGDVILIYVLVKTVGAQHLRDLDQLVVVVVPVEERLLTEDLERRKARLHDAQHGTHHGSKHAAIAPHVQTVVILLEVHEELRSLEVARRHTDVVCSPWMVKLGQAPVNQSQLYAWSDDASIEGTTLPTFLRS